MNELDVDRLLRSMPREIAREEFTSRVMARVARRPAPTSTLRLRTWPGFAQAVAATLFIALSIAFGVAWERQQEARRTASIRAEALRLRAEVDSLKRAAQQSQEIYLGQSGDREYVLDLRQFTAPAAEVRPVSQHF